MNKCSYRLRNHFLNWLSRYTYLIYIWDVFPSILESLNCFRSSKAFVYVPITSFNLISDPDVQEQLPAVNVILVFQLLHSIKPELPCVILTQFCPLWNPLGWQHKPTFEVVQGFIAKVIEVPVTAKLAVPDTVKFPVILLVHRHPPSSICYFTTRCNWSAVDSLCC